MDIWKRGEEKIKSSLRRKSLRCRGITNQESVVTARDTTDGNNQTDLDPTAVTYVDLVFSNLEVSKLANNDFSLSLYAELAKNENENIFFSAFGIRVVMFVASFGAASETFDEILATIHLNETTRWFMNLLTEATFVRDQLKLASGMFVDKSINIKNTFSESSTNDFRSVVEKLNFKDDPKEQCRYMNNWVSDKTNNKIQELFSPGIIDNDTTSVLVSALYFDCSWEYSFSRTENEDFYLTTTNTVKVEMMGLRNNLKYYHNKELKFAALELPYERYAYKMIILLPDTYNGLKNLEKNLSKIKLHEISNRMTTEDVIVQLPRFKLEKTLRLEETLSSLGCPTMFTDDADFSNINENILLRVNTIVHKAAVNVKYEKRTKTTKITRCNSEGVSASFKPKYFVADHPFFLSILTRNNIVLFAGRLLKV